MSRLFKNVLSFSSLWRFSARSRQFLLFICLTNCDTTDSWFDLIPRDCQKSKIDQFYFHCLVRLSNHQVILSIPIYYFFPIPIKHTHSISLSLSSLSHTHTHSLTHTHTQTHTLFLGFTWGFYDTYLKYLSCHQ